MKSQKLYKPALRQIGQKIYHFRVVEIPLKQTPLDRSKLTPLDRGKVTPLDRTKLTPLFDELSCCFISAA